MNNINGVINKNFKSFLFPSDINLAWKVKQKQRELTKNLFFLFFYFFLSKQQFFKGDSTKSFGVKC